MQELQQRLYLLEETNWSNETSISSYRSQFPGAGTSTLALAFGGNDGTTQTAATEEWDGTGFITKTITTTTD